MSKALKDDSVKISIEFTNDFGIKNHYEVSYSEKMTLLEHIEEAGGVAPYGCRNGSCGTCIAVIEKGQQFMAPMDFLEEDTCSQAIHSSEPIKPGSMTRLLCRAQLNSEQLAQAARDKAPVEICVRKIKIV